MANKQKILIVDDDTNISELISLYLTKECFETKCVEDGESALEAFKSFCPNLILLDLAWFLFKLHQAKIWFATQLVWNF